MGGVIDTCCGRWINQTSFFLLLLLLGKEALAMLHLILLLFNVRIECGHGFLVLCVMEDASTNTVSNRPSKSGECQSAQDSDPQRDGEGSEHVLPPLLVDICCINCEEHVFTSISSCVIIGEDDRCREQAAG